MEFFDIISPDAFRITFISGPTFFIVILIIKLFFKRPRLWFAEESWEDTIIFFVKEACTYSMNLCEGMGWVLWQCFRIGEY